MFHVREHLTDLPEYMKLNELYRWLREEDLKRYLLVEDGGPEVSDMDVDPLMSFDVKAKRLLTELHSNADEDIMKKIDDLVKKVCQNVRKLSYLCWSTFNDLLLYRSDSSRYSNTYLCDSEQQPQ